MFGAAEKRHVYAAKRIGASTVLVQLIRLAIKPFDAPGRRVKPDKAEPQQ